MVVGVGHDQVGGVAQAFLIIEVAVVDTVDDIACLQMCIERGIFQVASLHLVDVLLRGELAAMDGKAGDAPAGHHLLQVVPLHQGAPGLIQQAGHALALPVRMYRDIGAIERLA